MRPSFQLDLAFDGATPVGNQGLRYLVRSSASETEYAVGQIRVAISRVSGEVKVDVPFTTADQLYYSQESNKLRLSNDPRVLYDGRSEADPRGFYSLLQFGTTVPPLTLWRGISEFIPGREVTIGAGGKWISDAGQFAWPGAKKQEGSLELESQLNVLTDLIDEILIESCPRQDPVILFSGGVDSGVLAARAAAMGWKGTTLVNYCFGKDDKESELAANMAQQLGLKFVRINGQDCDTLEVLDNIGRVYVRPFGDPSLSPTYALASAVIERFPSSRVIFDGTGADGAFGLYSKMPFYRKLYRIPKPIRNMAGLLYERSESWMTNSSFERIGRILRRSAQLPMVLGAIARNPLANIAYPVQPEIQREVLELATNWINENAPSESFEVRLPAADLAINCSRVLAQKTKSVFDACDRKVVYPFLDGRMVGLAIQRARYWPGRTEPKRVLKAMLASCVPPEMVYRPKSGFVGPYRTIFSQPKFLSKLDQLIECKATLTNFVDLPVLKKLRDAIQSQLSLPDQTYWFIWSAVFAHCWLESLEDRKAFSGVLGQNSA